MDMRLICVMLGYLCGSFLTADVVVRIRTGQFRRDSFGNPGTANVTSRLGIRWGMIVLCGDILKTVLACIGGWQLLPGPERLGVLYAGLGAVIGHCWPVWNGFRGGKGIACAGAVAVLFSPVIGVGALLGGGAAVLAIGYLAVGSAVIAVLLPLLALLLKKGVQPVVMMAAMGAVLLLRHRENFARIAAGMEHRNHILKSLQNRGDRKL